MVSGAAGWSIYVTLICIAAMIWFEGKDIIKKLDEIIKRLPESKE